MQRRRIPALRRILVRAPSRTYPVFIGRGAVSRAGELLASRGAPLGQNSGIFILSSPRVWRHWGAKLAASLRRSCGSRTILFDDRELGKSLANVERLCRRLVRAGADRHTVIVALGGGVVGDVAGFVAASYMRGVPLVHVPTTLVAQVDSAIGGKTGVNLPEGKNLIGAFYQPHLVLTDPDVLLTLPARQYRSGLYEVIKYGVIGDARLFRFLELHLDDLLRRDPAGLGWVLARCIRAKAEVVRRDERESGAREILNLGHTIGHALESVTGYRRFLHGEAVGWGLMAATLIALAMDLLDAATAARIVRLVSRVGPLPSAPEISAARLLGAMATDKKTRGRRLRFVLPRRIGRVTVVDNVSEALVGRVFAALPSVAREAT